VSYISISKNITISSSWSRATYRRAVNVALIQDKIGGCHENSLIRGALEAWTKIEKVLRIISSCLAKKEVRGFHQGKYWRSPYMRSISKK